MTGSIIKFKVEDQELRKIIEDLEGAMNTLLSCETRLRMLGYIEFEKPADE